MKLATYRLGHDHPKGGLRLGTVRLPPRAKKSEWPNYFDVWLPTLAPSRELLSRFKKGEITHAQLFKRYRSEMRASTDARQAVQLVAELALRMPVHLGCYCEDETKCHRSVLRDLVEQAAR